MKTIGKTMLAIVMGLAIGNELQPATVPSVWRLPEVAITMWHSRYMQMGFDNPLVQVGGCICMVYAIWFMVVPLPRLANLTNTAVDEIADDLDVSQGIITLLGIVFFWVAVIWSMLQFGWALNR